MDDKTSLDWFNALEIDGLEDLKLDFAVALERALHSVAMNRKDLAAQVNVTPARITKVLRGDANLTMEVMHKLARAVDHKIHIHLAPEHAQVRWLNVMTTQNRVIGSPAYLPQAPSQVINEMPQYAEAA